MREMCAQLKTGSGCTPELEALILQLSDRLSKTGGKKVYGFLKPDVKAIVDRIVDELAKDERVAACYSAWYDLREEVLRTYHDEMPARVPLSSLEEFKQIKNMVIAEVISLGDPDFIELSREPIVDLPKNTSSTRDDAEASITNDSSRRDSGVRNPHLLAATTRLFQQLGKIFEQQHQQLGGQTAHIDRKRMRKLREKKISQGHARDEQTVGR
jgi:hypothetical protein